MTRVLLRYLLKTGAVLITAAALLAYFLLGREVAIGLFIGAALALADGAGLVYLVGQLLEPNSKRGKPLLFAILFTKLLVVALALWIALTIFGVSGLGLVCGVGVALAALVIGVNRGSSSEDGKRAMDEDEARIAREMEQELGDKDAESG